MIRPADRTPGASPARRDPGYPVVDTGRLPPGGFHFAPGTIEGGLARRGLGAVLLDWGLRLCILLVICILAGAIVAVAPDVPVFPVGVIAGALGVLVVRAE